MNLCTACGKPVENLSTNKNPAPGWDGEGKVSVLFVKIYKFKIGGLYT